MSKRTRMSLGPTVARQIRTNERNLAKLVIKSKERDPVRVSAHNLLRTVEEAIAAGAVRLPYHGLLEAVVALRRALK